MKTTLDRFLSELDQLERYLEYINSVGDILKYKQTDGDSAIINERLDKTKKILTDLPFRKVFEYNSIIISMYGFFEKFIETVLVAYLDQLCFYVPAYDNLPKPIKENHSMLSAELIRNLNVPKYEHESLNMIAAKLHSCLSNNRSELNTMAFTDHSSNFRISSITEFFSRIGIKSISNKIKNNDSFHGFLNERLGSDINTHKTEDAIIFNLLSELAQRRNEISHGSSLDAPILSSSVFPEYIEFLRRFGTAVYEILRDSMLEFECSRDFIMAAQVDIFNNNILCLEVKSIVIAIGDRILVRSGSETNYTFSERVIEEIQIDNKPFSTINVDEVPLRIGFKLDGRVNKKQTFYVKRT